MMLLLHSHGHPYPGRHPVLAKGHDDPRIPSQAIRCGRALPMRQRRKGPIRPLPQGFNAAMQQYYAAMHHYSRVRSIIPLRMGGPGILTGSQQHRLDAIARDFDNRHGVLLQQ